MARALAPVAVWTVDEGLGGLAVHVANDRPEPLAATLRVALYRDGEQHVGEAAEEVLVAPHAVEERDVEALLGRFVDVSWAYRFGPPAQDAVVATLVRDGTTVAQAFRFPAGRPLAPEPAARLGLEAAARPAADGRFELAVRTRRLAHGVRIHAEGFAVDDDAFSVEPGGERVVVLTARAPDATLAGAALTALNLDGRVRVREP